MQIHVSPEISSLLEHAAALATHKGQLFVGVEHLYAAVLDTPEALPEAVRENLLNRFYSVLREVQRNAWRGQIRLDMGDIFHTPRCIDTLHQAAKLAQRTGSAPTGPLHILLALFSDGLSAPSRAMDGLKLDRKGCIELLRKAAYSLPAASGAVRTAPQATQATHTPPEDHPDARFLPEENLAPSTTTQQLAPTPAPTPTPKALAQSLTRNLSALARSEKLEAAIGRDNEIGQILQILTRKNKNNVMLVGEAGVGKTRVVEGVARNMARRKLTDSTLLPNFTLLELNLATLMAGTQYRGVLEEKLNALLETLRNTPDTVLFIDEIHLIMGAGAVDGSSIDIANLLKPVLARGEIRCIGATTVQEYRKFVAKDPAIERRFQMVRLEELSEKDTRHILKHLRPALEKHHQVQISDQALDAAIRLTQRYMPNLNFPDKAIDVLDQACARYRLKRMAIEQDLQQLFDTPFVDEGNRVTPHDIRKVVSQISAIPLEEMTAAERMQINDLGQRLRQRIIGQDEAITKTVAAVKKSRAGLSDPNRPDSVLLFLGPTGVGKTQLAKSLAQCLFGSSKHLITFDMSEFIEEHSVSRLLGAPPGYAGHEEEGRLIAAVRNTPFAILLFDEIEKAHPRIFDIFLPIFEEGRLKDNRGRFVSFRNCIIILTSNLAADLLYRSESGDMRRRLIEELRGRFRPEFINRIDEIVPFYQLLDEDIRSILRLEINALRNRLAPRRIGVRMYQRAYLHLAAQGYSAEFGAREIRRVVDQLVIAPISELILNGAFSRGDMIDVLMEDGVLTFRKGEPHRSQKEGAPHDS